MSVVLDRYLWSVEEYDRLCEMGFFDKDDRVELIRGEIITHTSARKGESITARNPLNLTMTVDEILGEE